MKKYLAVAVILLFIGVSFAPSINANISKEMVEFTTEICGLDGGKQTVKLIREEAEEVDVLFKSIRERLNETETREEAEEIFKEAVVELDKYGLLGGLSVEQARQIVTVNYENHKLMELLKTIYQKYKGAIDENRNLLCFIAGTTNRTNFDSQLELFCGRILFLLGCFGPIFFKNKFPLYTIFILGYFLLDFFNSFNPMSAASRINLGGERGGGWHPEFVDFYAHGWIVTTGLLGTQRYEGMMQGGLPIYGSGTIFDGYIYKFFPGVLGFTGLHIYNPIQSKHFYLGSALWVKINTEPPWL
ncbi:MAG: hypothetical protein JSW60_06675 [Thermoplasmatales archaeon]|nr:MAG: hypothetical protein JSW60_06675 [Thermoplasmatales archaeon]